MLLNINIDHKILAKHFKKTNEAMRQLKRKNEENGTGLWKVYVDAYNYYLSQENKIKKNEQLYTERWLNTKVENNIENSKPPKNIRSIDLPVGEYHVEFTNADLKIWKLDSEG